MSNRWQLAIECSSTGGSIALSKHQTPALTTRLGGQTLLPADRGSVQTLAPAIDQALREAQLKVDDLEFLSVTVGPGSFTGLRVGLATVKMLAMACAKPIAPVDTLAAIAVRLADAQRPSAGQPLRLVTAINAYRKQVFTASWFISAEGIWNLRPASVVDVSAWSADPWGADTPQSPENAPHSEDDSANTIWISGSALEAYPMPSGGETPAQPKPHQPSPDQPSQGRTARVPAALYRAAPSELWQPLAEHVGTLGWEVYQHGRAVSAAELLPNYIRQSAAEEKRKQQA